MNRIARLLAVIVCAILAVAPAFARSPLTFQERVAAQTAIERVYYNHRLWPKENPQPKPPFEQMVPRKLIESKVEDSLKKCSALETFWHRPITADQIQAEMDRMAAQTKDPAMLKELFDALDNDPVLIAECLARPMLADREIRSWYAYDARFQGETKQKAEAALKDAKAFGLAAVTEGTPLHLRYTVDGDADPQALEDSMAKDGIVRVPVSKDELDRQRRQMPEEGKWSGVVESDGAFTIYRTISSDEGTLEVEGRVFDKPSFNLWWAAQRVPSFTDDSNPDFDYHVTAPGRNELSATTCLGTWDPVLLHTPPQARWGHTAVWTGTEMIVWGGQLNTGGRYSPATGAWQPTSTGDGCPSERQANTAIWTGSEMVVWGGVDNSNNSFNTGARYNPESDTWLPTSTSGAPTARGYHTAVWTGSQMIVWGGWWYDGTVHYENTGARYNPESDSWSATSTGSNCPDSRWMHTAVWTGNYMIIWGGVSAPSGAKDTGGRYDPLTDAWLPTVTSGDCPSARQLQDAVWTGTEMIVWGGIDNLGSLLNSGGRYNPATDSWTTTSTNAPCPSPRVTFSIVWTGNRMIIWGGNLEGSIPTATGAMYDPVSNSWTSTAEDGACPEARRDHSAVWTGTEMIIWGGINGSKMLNTGGRYNPLSDSWVPTSPANIPDARIYHHAVWTGTEMIVWGGLSQVVSNTGARFNPATDSWTPTSTGSECPDGRYLFSSVWTGSEMIVWGGQANSSICLNSGGRYNPSSDSWIPTSQTGSCPTARTEHTAVWTGSEMIVWGGSDGANLTNTGGQYNPYDDIWTSTSTQAPCPSARSRHSAVWSGTEMIVWGGVLLNTGGRYDPVHDSWTATSTSAGCPAGRSSQKAVWTGSQMIVWGGTGQSGPYGVYLNSGARYSPSSDSWTPTSTSAPCPTGRSAFDVLWTGDEMIVWGGYWYDGSDHYERTGGRYDPSSNSWRPTQLGTNCPAARSYPTAVWTGSAMLVWGGEIHSSGFTRYSDGGVYTVTGPPLGSPSSLAAPSPVDVSPCSTGIDVTWPQDAGDWSDGGSGEYRSYEVYRNGAPVASGGCSGTFPYGSTNCSDDTTSANGSYTYQVRYVNACDMGTLSPLVPVIDQVLATPPMASNPSPANGTQSVVLSPTLTWNPLPNVSSYDVYFGTSPSPPMAFSTATPTYSPGELLPDTVYYWRIVATNDCYTGPTSPTWTFRTRCPAPVCSGDPAPVDGSQGVLTASALTWSAAEGASSYDVYFGTAPDPPLAGTVATTTFTPTSMAPSTTYHWKVVPKSVCGSAEGCMIWSFRTCDLPLPASSPSPAHEATSVLLTSPLSWSPVDGATSYDVYLGPSPSPAFAGSVTGASYTPSPLTPSATYYWKVVPKNDCGSAEGVPTWSFTTCDLPAAAAVPAPADSATSVLLTSPMSWSPVAGATAYDVYLGTSPSPAFAATVTGATYTPAPLSPSTTYHWKVVPKNDCGSAEGVAIWSFTTCDLPPAPSVPMPADGAGSVPLTTTLGWTPSSGATAYDVYLGTTQPPQFAGSVTGPAYAPARLSSGAVYYWKVVPKNDCGSAVGCPTWSFTACTLPASVSTHSPAEGASSVPLTTALSWGSVSGADTYDVYFGAPADPPFVSSTTGTTYTPGPLSPSTTYHWKVVPKNDCGEAEGIAIWSFTSCALPPAAASPSPADGAIGVLRTTPLTWGAVALADSYDVYFGTTSSPPLVGNVATNAFSPGTLSPGATYYWKIVPKNACGSAGACPVWSFQTCELPAAATSPVPTDGAAAVTMRPTLSWSAVENATAYEVYFGASPSPGLAATVTTPSYTPPALSGSTTYYWKIVPKNSCGSALGAATWSFTTVAPPVISQVTKMGSPFRLKVMGNGFLSGAVIKVDGQSVPQTKFKNATKLVAKGGGTLKAMVPKGQQVCVTVENPDGGFSQCTLFTR